MSDLVGNPEDRFPLKLKCMFRSVLFIKRGKLHVQLQFFVLDSETRHSAIYAFGFKSAGQTARIHCLTCAFAARIFNSLTNRFLMTKLTLS